MTHWDSLNELNAFRLLDVEPAVRSFAEQPCKITYRLSGAEHDHYPDILVERTDGSRELWEVKTTRDARRTAYVARSRFLETALPAWGYAYRVVLAEDLGREPRLTTATTLLKFGQRALDPLVRERMRRLVVAAGSVCWGACLDIFLGMQTRCVLARLVLEGALSVDLESEICDTTQFVAAPRLLGTAAFDGQR